MEKRYMINIEIARAYCNENIEDIENFYKALSDKKELWHVHHKLGETISRKELQERDMYYNRPANELIFLSPLEHCLRHHPDAKTLYMDDDGVVKKMCGKKNRLHGTGTLYKKRGRGCWRVKWMVAGKLHDVSTHCLDWDEADTKAKQIIQSA